MPIPASVEYLVKRHEKMRALRDPFNTDWNDIRNFVRPITVTFNPTTGMFVTVRTEYMFDGTAPEALEELGAALHSFITNPAERWFEVQVEGVPEEQLDTETLEWLDQVSEIIYAEYKRESSCLNLALHEVYLDIGSFGTAILYQEWDSEIGGLSFAARPIQYCFFLENSKGRVDVTHVRHDWTLRQVKQEFGAILQGCPKLMEVKDEDKVFEIIHAVHPRTDRIPGNVNPRNKAYASVWFCMTTKEILSESGYDGLPYHVPRWTKLAGEIYGRGPAKKCLADIKMLNAMERTVLKAGQKAVDPPLVLANEGFMLPIRTSPGALIFKEDEERKIEPLVFQGNLPWAEEKCEQKRKFIEKCFYADWIKMEKDNVEMTAYEVADRRDEKLRMMAPMLGRLVTELHGPMIARSYDLLNSHGRIPLAPATIQGKTLRVGYMSPAAVAQLGSRANTISRFLNDLLPMSQAHPEVLDVIDMDAATQEYALARRVPRKILRSPKDLAEMRAQKQQAQSAQQMAQIAEPASQSIKNIADAQKTGAMM